MPELGLRSTLRQTRKARHYRLAVCPARPSPSDRLWQNNAPAPEPCASARYQISRLNARWLDRARDSVVLSSCQSTNRANDQSINIPASPILADQTTFRTKFDDKKVEGRGRSPPSHFVPKLVNGWIIAPLGDAPQKPPISHRRNCRVSRLASLDKIYQLDLPFNPCEMRCGRDPRSELEVQTGPGSRNELHRLGCCPP